MKKLRAAVVGVGYLGRFHAQKYKNLEAELPVQLVAVCDSNFEQAMKIGAELGVPGYRDVRDLTPHIDIATVATATRGHFEVAKTLLEAGIHTNVEKPMTVTVNEARELVGLAKEKNVHLCVGHSERFNPAFMRARELMTEPRVIELIRHAPYKARGADVSVIHDLMVHDIDLLRSIVPGELQLLNAKGGTLISSSLDWASAYFGFGNGGTAFISVSRVAPAMTRSLRILGTKESLTADLQSGEVQIARMQSVENVQIETQQAGKGDNLLTETREFIQLVSGQKNSAVTGDHGLAALEWVQKLMSHIGVKE